MTQVILGGVFVFAVAFVLEAICVRVQNSNTNALLTVVAIGLACAWTNSIADYYSRYSGTSYTEVWMCGIILALGVVLDGAAVYRWQNRYRSRQT